MTIERKNSQPVHIFCRFNSYDGRLDRVMESAVLMMEAFEGHENKFQYDIVGHSGESYDLRFVDKATPPSNNKERLDLIKALIYN